MSEWISVESLPLPKDGTVLAYTAGGRNRFHVAECHPNIVTVGGLFAFDREPITHWMPLPPPPL